MKKLLLFPILFLYMTPAVLGARYPNAVEKTYTLSGGQLMEFLQLFGIGKTELKSASLPLSEGNSWAIYLLKKDTIRELLNYNDGMPVRENSILLKDAKNPTAIIGPYWLDEGTQLPDGHPGWYRFDSPPIAKSNEDKGEWSNLLRKLIAHSNWNHDSDIGFLELFTFENRVMTRFIVRRVEKEVYVISLEIKDGG